MELTVVRTNITNDYTEGQLFIDGKYFCDTIEDKDRGLYQGMPMQQIRKIKINHETCIPYGTYKVSTNLDHSGYVKTRPTYLKTALGKYIPHILNVPGFEGILIHQGYNKNSSSGCLILGKKCSNGAVGDSWNYIYKLYELLAYAKRANQSVNITYKRGDGVTNPAEYSELSEEDIKRIQEEKEKLDREYDENINDILESSNSSLSVLENEFLNDESDIAEIEDYSNDTYGTQLLETKTNEYLTDSEFEEIKSSILNDTLDKNKWGESDVENKDILNVSNKQPIKQIEGESIDSVMSQIKQSMQSAIQRIDVPDEDKLNNLPNIAGLEVDNVLENLIKDNCKSINESFDEIIEEYSKPAYKDGDSSNKDPDNIIQSKMTDEYKQVIDDKKKRSKDELYEMLRPDVVRSILKIRTNYQKFQTYKSGIEIAIPKFLSNQATPSVITVGSATSTPNPLYFLNSATTYKEQLNSQIADTNSTVSEIKQECDKIKFKLPKDIEAEFKTIDELKKQINKIPG